MVEEREIVLDTETTGLKTAEGHRIVEIGCVELSRRIPTGRVFQRYLNPERPMPEEARRVHKLTDAFLRGQPRFAGIAEELLAFLGAAPLVMHNAEFDLGFLNMELARIDRPPLPPSRVVDTLALARARFPGQKISLDALCSRMGIDLRAREEHGHGALLDAHLLCGVYLELTGGRQASFGLDAPAARRTGERRGAAPSPRPAPGPVLPGLLTEAEAHAHARLVESLGPEALWKDYL